MAGFVDRHRTALISLVIVLGVAGLIYVESANRGGPAEGTALPSFSLPVAGASTRVTDRDLAGKITVLDFWATWCGPCRTSLPKVDALATRYEGRVDFYAVNADNEDPAEVLAFRDALGLKMPVLLDGMGLMGKLGSHSLPTTVILGRDGKVVRSFVGAVPASDIADVLDAL